MSLHVYAYVSDSAPTLKQSDLQNILHTAQRFNGENDITGVPIHSGLVFIQILEGRKEVLHGLIERIRNDVRNTNLKVIVDEPAEARRFPEWSMKLFRTDSVLNCDVLTPVLESRKATIYDSVEKLIYKSSELKA